jgi:hypothetical protein
MISPPSCQSTNRIAKSTLGRMAPTHSGRFRPGVDEIADIPLKNPEIRLFLALGTIAAIPSISVGQSKVLGRVTPSVRPGETKPEMVTNGHIRI